MNQEKPHKKLTLWLKTMDLVVGLYKATRSLPKEEEYGLKSQMRRAVVSIPSNIAEGLSRVSLKEKLKFLDISRSSLSELDAQVEVCKRLNFMEPPAIESLEAHMNQVGALLSGLIRSIRSKLK